MSVLPSVPRAEAVFENSVTHGCTSADPKDLPEVIGLDRRSTEQASWLDGVVSAPVPASQTPSPRKVVSPGGRAASPH